MSLVSNKWLLDLRDAALAVRDTFVNVLIPAFQVIRDQAGLVATAFNTLFGTALTGDQLLVGATVLKLLGVFRLLFAVVKVGAQSFMLFVNALRLIGPVGTVIARLFPVIASGIGTVLRMLPMLAAFFSPQGLIAVGVIALGALIYGFWDEIVAGASAALSGLTTIFSSIWDGLTVIAETALSGLVTVVSDVWTGLTTASQTAWTGLTTAWRDVWIGITTVVSDARSGLITVVTGIWTGITETVTSGAGWIVRGRLPDLGGDHRGGQCGCDNDPADLGWDRQWGDHGSDGSCRSCAAGLVWCHPGCRCQCRGDQGGNRPSDPDCR